MSDKDKLVVENYVIAGLSLETLYRCFPGFPKDEIDKVYSRVIGVDTEAERVVVSVNCS